MTKLNLQKINFEDCESEIERAYFDWGRIYTTIPLPQAWENALPQERFTITRRGYSLYDGLDISRDAQITISDIYSSVGINSRVLVYDAVRFLQHSEESRSLLTLVPDNVSLEDAPTRLIEAVTKLIKLFDDEDQLGPGKVTKVLHKKRPAFIPVLDSVVIDFLYKNFPHRLYGNIKIDKVLFLYQEILQVLRNPLMQIQRNLQKEGILLTNVRILDFLIWIKWRTRSPYGYGMKIIEVWSTSNISEARVKAKKSWEERMISSTS